MGLAARKLATWEDLWVRLEERLEVLGGEVVEKAAGDGVHGGAQASLTGAVVPVFSRRGGGGNPGGWWIRTETDIEFGLHDVLRPDIAGWRRDRVPEAPSGFPVRVLPDWVCEVLSPSTAWRDLGEKRDVYHRGGVSHYWVVHPVDRVITVYARNPRTHEVVASCGIIGRVRLPPFDAVEFEAARLFGLEPEESGDVER